MTSKEAAIDLIRVYVERGDTLDQLRRGQMGSYNSEYGASIGGSIFPAEYHDRIMECPNHLINKVPSTKILVERVGDKVVNEVFTLESIFNLIKNSEPIQLQLV